MKNYDFGGWATRFNIKCADGRTILPEAFADCDGQTVPIVWNHQHKEANNVLGHALLQNRNDGVYCYGTFNDNPEGRGAKELVKHGDITSLSIYANGLKHVNGKNVQHGTIREVSLVLAGANPGAYIDDIICHSEDGSDEGVVIYSGMDFEEVSDEISHAAQNDEDDDNNDNETGIDIYNTLNDKQKTLFAYVVMQLTNENEKEAKHSMEHSLTGAISSSVAHNLMNSAMEHSDEVGEYLSNLSDAELDEMIDTLEHSLIGDSDDVDLSALSDAELDNMIDTLEHSVIDNNNVDDILGSFTEAQLDVLQHFYEAEEENYESEDNTMTHNVFENQNSGDYIAHAREAATEMFAEALADAKTYGSLKESVLAHGIEDIDILFPDAKTMDNEIDLVTRNMDWVKVVMDGVHKTPFSRVRSIFADLTDDDARALGYIKGNFKKEQVFTLLKRETQPTTIYKKQKIHRDDLVDITDFDIVRLVMKEMRMLLEEEIARAILVGDGRNPSSNDKVNENCIRPIWTDEDFFTIKYLLPDDSGRAFVEGAVRARVNYKGKGNPTLFVTEQKLTELLLMTDAVGRDLYDSVEKLATKLRVAKVVTVPVMDGLVRVDAKTGKAYALQGLIVNLTDYNTGTDKGGEVKTFDQFDIDYNAQKYLIETRLSGAMVTPFAAIALETETTAPETND